MNVPFTKLRDDDSRNGIFQMLRNSIKVAVDVTKEYTFTNIDKIIIVYSILILIGSIICMILYLSSTSSTSPETDTKYLYIVYPNLFLSVFIAIKVFLIRKNLSTKVKIASAISLIVYWILNAYQIYTNDMYTLLVYQIFFIIFILLFTLLKKITKYQIVKKEEEI